MKTFFQFMEDMGMSDQQFGKDQGEGLTTMQKGVMNKFFNALETELRPMIAKLKTAMANKSSEGEEAPAEAHPEAM